MTIDKSEATRAEAADRLDELERVGALESALAERDRVIEAAKGALWVCAEHNALYHGEQHNTVTQARAALRAIEEMRRG